jgi:serine O-acetyltransferase
LRLVHRGGIIVNPLTIIDKNVTLFRGCTLGSSRRGKFKGAPIISEEVWIGANAAIIGNVKIGRNSLIAPNSFVNFNVPPNSICIGNPAKIIKRENATEFYIDNII